MSKNRSRNSDEDPFPYKTQLQMIKQLLQADKPDDPIRIEEIIGVLGNTVNALYSVPTAIYCFLKAHTGFPEVKVSLFSGSFIYKLHLFHVF